MKLRYHYKSATEIDNETRDYLEFVMPAPVDTFNISEINAFLTTIDDYYEKTSQLTSNATSV
jgi:hypothetical protein